MNGQVERLHQSRFHRYHYGTHAQLKHHLQAFLLAYNFANRLKTLRGLTPCEHICSLDHAAKSVQAESASGLNT